MIKKVKSKGKCYYCGKPVVLSYMFSVDINDDYWEVYHVCDDCEAMQFLLRNDGSAYQFFENVDSTAYYSYIMLQKINKHLKEQYKLNCTCNVDDNKEVYDKLINGIDKVLNNITEEEYKYLIKQGKD